MNWLMLHEGEWSNHPSDPGGVTRWGVSLRWLKSLPLDVGDFDGDGEITVDDLRAMTAHDRDELFRQRWWLPYRYDSFADLSIAKRVFSASVNMGFNSSHKILQRAIRSATGVNLVDDGVLGTKTMTALPRDVNLALLGALKSETAGFYRLLARTRPDLAVFETGWLNRAYA
jgi:lysozyme family protein